MAGTPISAILSANLVASAVSVVVTVGVYLAIARVTWKPPLGESVIGSLCSAYVNAGNLGIPIALYVLGDISLMAPTLSAPATRHHADRPGPARRRPQRSPPVADDGLP